MRLPSSTNHVAPYMAGRRDAAARSMIGRRWIVSNGPGETTSAPTRSLVSAAKAASRSLSFRTPVTRSPTPNARPAASSSFWVSKLPGLARSKIKATQVASGTTSLEECRSGTSCLSGHEGHALFILVAGTTLSSLPPSLPRWDSERDGSRRGGDQLHLLDQAGRSIPPDECDPVPPFERMVEAIETNRLLPVSALDGSVACQKSVSLCLTLAHAV